MITNKHGARHRGARGAMAPPPRILLGGGPIMHLAPHPNFSGNSVFYKINVLFFFEKKVECMHRSVHCTLLFISGYCSIHVYSQTHLHDLLVAHYTGNMQSTL